MSYLVYIATKELCRALWLAIIIAFFVCFVNSKSHFSVCFPLTHLAYIRHFSDIFFGSFEVHRGNLGYYFILQKRISVSAFADILFCCECDLILKGILDVFPLL